MSKKLISLVLVLALAGISSAATIQWVGPGTSEAWETASNWNGTIAAADTVKAYGTAGANITVSTNIGSFTKLQNQSWGGSCNIEITSTGTLNVDGSIEQGKGTSSTLMLIDAGGVFNAARRIVSTVGTYKVSSASSGTSDIVDVYGTLNVKGSLATSDLSVGPGTGTSAGRVIVRNGGLVDVDAYVINATVIATGTYAGQTRGQIKLYEGGLMKIKGDKTIQVNADITAGTIVGKNGTAGYLGVWTRTEGGQLYTYVPEPATIALLGLGSLMLLRRKR